MQLPNYLVRPTIPIAYLQLLLEILAERGIGPQALLPGSGLPAGALESASASMSAYHWTRLVLRALDITGDAGLGYEYGLRMRPTLHGVLGYASMTATSLRQALELSVRYSRIRQAHFSMRFEERPGYGLLVLEEKYPIPVIRSFFIENILLGIARAQTVLLGRELSGIDGVEIWFDWPEPPYHAAWREHLPSVRFNQTCNAVRFATTALELRPVLADPHASQQAIVMCERELALEAAVEGDVVIRVRAALTPGNHGGYLQLEEVAGRLSMSSRSVKRKLQQGGTSFLLLLEEARRRDARHFLLDTELSVQEIATRLGYLNPANFTRAFRKWTGMSPTAFRGQQGSAQ